MEKTEATLLPAGATVFSYQKMSRCISYSSRGREHRKRNGVNLSYRLYSQRYYEHALERYKWLHAFLQCCNENFHEEGKGGWDGGRGRDGRYDTCTSFRFILQGGRVFLINSGRSSVLLCARQRINLPRVSFSGRLP